MAELVGRPDALPVGSAGHKASGWWGMWMMIFTEASLFAYLLFSYAYLGMQSHGGWVPELPKLQIALPNTVLLIASSLVLYWGERGIKEGRKGRLVAALGITLLMGAAFAGLQGLEWHNKKYGPSADAYASTYYMTTGFHMAHVLGGLLMLSTLLLWAAMGKFDARRHVAVSIGALYWHFVDAVWLAVFATFYVSPYLVSGHG